MSTSLNYDLWVLIVREIIESHPHRKVMGTLKNKDVIDLRRSSTIKAVLSTNWTLRNALIGHLSKITTLTINEGLIVCSTAESDDDKEYLLDTNLLTLLLELGCPKLKALRFNGDGSGGEEFTLDVLPSSEKFLTAESQHESLLRMCIQYGSPLKDAEQFLQAKVGAINAVSIELHTVNVLFEPELLWFNKAIPPTRKRLWNKSFCPTLCSSKFNRLLNINAEEVRFDFSLIEEGEFMEFVEILWRDYPCARSTLAPIAALSIKRFELVDEFAVSASDLRIPVQQYVQLCQYVAVCAPNLSHLTISLDALYRERSPTARNLQRNIGRLCTHIVTLAEQLAAAFNNGGGGRGRRSSANGIMDINISFTLRNSYIQEAVESLSQHHELFKMGSELEKESDGTRFHMKRHLHPHWIANKASVHYAITFIYDNSW